MLLDQAQALRSMVEQEQSSAAGSARARVIAVTSGKGGVGKSNVCVNLAVLLSQWGRRVILLDADLGTANADVLCNLPPGRNIAHVIAGHQTLEQAMIQGPGGFRLVPGASGLACVAALDDSARRRLAQEVRQLESAADLVLIDTGAGVSPNVLTFLACADQQLVVTTPEPTAVTDAYAVIKAMTRQMEHLDVNVLVNMTRDEAEARGVFERLDGVCRRFLSLTPRYAGHVPTDARVGLAVRRRCPFVIDSPLADASQSVRQLAHRLDRHAREPRAGGLLSRMANWLSR